MLVFAPVIDLDSIPLVEHRSDVRQRAFDFWRAAEPRKA
jgi:hypothetical protein